MPLPDDLLRVLPADTATTWELIAPVIPAQAYLVGGTAIAVHLHHRESRDLDFFYHGDDTVDLDALTARLQRIGRFAVQRRDAGTLNGLFSETKLQVLNADQVRPQHLLEEPQIQFGLRIAGLRDLLATKIKVVGDRAELRDYFDLMSIEERSDLTLEEGLRLYVDRYRPDDPSSLVHIVKALGDFTGIEEDRSLGVSRKAIERWFARRQPELALSLGRDGFPKPGTKPRLSPQNDPPDGTKSPQQRPGTDFTP